LQVICRELGAASGEAVTKLTAVNLDIRLPLWVRDSECTGEEESIQDCAFSSNVVPGGEPPVYSEAVRLLEVSCCPL
jgi:hypothetical protein